MLGLACGFSARIFTALLKWAKHLAASGHTVPRVAAIMFVAESTVRAWVHRPLNFMV